MAFPLKFRPMQCFGAGRSPRKKEESAQCSVSGEGLTVAVAGEPAKFLLRTSGPDLLFLELQITRVTKDGNENVSVTNEPIPVEYECISENLHAVCYYPKEEGKYHVGVTWKGSHVTGSPFVVKVVKQEKRKIAAKPEVKEKKKEDEEEVWKLRDDVKPTKRQRNTKI